MSDTFKIKDEEVQAELLKLGKYLKKRMPKNMGFTLLMSDFGEGGAMFYISSIERESSLESMKEYLIKQGKIPMDGAVPSPFVEEKKEEKTESGLPKGVEQMREAAVVFIKACIEAKAPTLRMAIGGFIGFGIDGQWEVIARRIEPPKP